MAGRARRTEDWAPAFLVALERSCMVSVAARAAGVARRTVYDRRARDEEFAAAWDEALETATEELEAEAYRRAIDSSDRLIMFLLRARRPSVYVERYLVKHGLDVLEDERPPVPPDFADPEVQARSRDLLLAIGNRHARLAAEAKANGGSEPGGVADAPATGRRGSENT